MQNDFLDRYDKIQRLNRNLTGGTYVSALGNIFGRIGCGWVGWCISNVRHGICRFVGGRKEEK